MQQLSLFENTYSDRIINVASVPQRSPFRYPGGKTWLVPRIRQWLSSLQWQPQKFIEPFAGGGIVSLTVAFEQLANHVTMIEIDEQVAAVWQTILIGNGVGLADKIANFDFSLSSVENILSNNSLNLEDKAFQTILKNRINRGGILAIGAGKIKNGENGKGIKSRWYPETLKQRIINIVAIQDRITFIHGDGMEFLAENAAISPAVFFIDPPYTAGFKKAGSRLYNYSEIDHEKLFKIASSLAGEFLMTYNDAEEIRFLAKKYGFATATVAMKNTHHAKMTELLISRNLDWVK